MCSIRSMSEKSDAGTSVAANYRAVCRAYTTPLFIALEQEAHELACIFSASLRTARINAKKRREANRKKSRVRNL